MAEHYTARPLVVEVVMRRFSTSMKLVSSEG
jgi:hypothetical protein